MIGDGSEQITVLAGEVAVTDLDYHHKVPDPVIEGVIKVSIRLEGHCALLLPAQITRLFLLGNDLGGHPARLSVSPGTLWGHSFSNGFQTYYNPDQGNFDRRF